MGPRVKGVLNLSPQLRHVLSRVRVNCIVLCFIQLKPVKTNFAICRKGLSALSLQ